MVDVWVEKVDDLWYGVAFCDEALVASATGAAEEETASSVVSGLRRRLACRRIDDPPSYARRVVRMLADIEAGNEGGKRFTLSHDHVPEPLRSVLYVSSAIPLGYVTTYGNIAHLAHTPARVVGRVMATNPLYPIVPCHRVVGADFALVGYGGRQDDAALERKLGRLRAEARGATAQAGVPTPSGSLIAYPVEWAIRHAEETRRQNDLQPSLFP